MVVLREAELCTLLQDCICYPRCSDRHVVSSLHGNIRCFSLANHMPSRRAPTQPFSTEPSRPQPSSALSTLCSLFTRWRPGNGMLLKMVFTCIKGAGGLRSYIPNLGCHGQSCKLQPCGDAWDTTAWRSGGYRAGAGIPDVSRHRISAEAVQRSYPLHQLHTTLP